MWLAVKHPSGAVALAVIQMTGLQLKLCPELDHSWSRGVAHQGRVRRRRGSCASRRSAADPSRAAAPPAALAGHMSVAAVPGSDRPCATIHTAAWDAARAMHAVYQILRSTSVHMLGAAFVFRAAFGTGIAALMRSPSLWCQTERQHSIGPCSGYCANMNASHLMMVWHTSTRCAQSWAGQMAYLMAEELSLKPMTELLGLAFQGALTSCMSVWSAGLPSSTSCPLKNQCRLHTDTCSFILLHVSSLMAPQLGIMRSSHVTF